MSATWLLILQLGVGAQVIPMPDLWSCIARSQFEIRFAPSRRPPLCVPVTGDVA